MVLSVVDRFVPKAHHRMTTLLNEILRGNIAQSHASAFWAAQAYALACWCVYALASVPLFLAFGFTLPTAFLASLSLTCFATTARFIPAAPGAVGTSEAMAVLAVLWVSPDTSTESAVAIAVTSHVIGIVAPALPGLVWLPMAWRDLKMSRRIEGKAER